MQADDILLISDKGIDYQIFQSYSLKDKTKQNKNLFITI